jgi:cyclohexadieny/prephenate dehydrogenase
VALQRAIRWGQGDILFDLFTRTRAIRRSVIQAGQAYERKPQLKDPEGEADGEGVTGQL